MADQRSSDHPSGAAPEALSSIDPTGAVDAHAPKQWAVGLPAVVNSFRHGFEQMGLPRTARVFGRLNQDQGFDCPSCAWPDPEAGDRHVAEFCESGAKAVSWEATKRRVDREFFARHNPDDLHRLGFHQGQVVDVVSEFEGVDRRAEGFTLVSYPAAGGCAAAYYPETNVLMSVDHVALRSNTPVAKALVIRFEARPATEAARTTPAT